MVVLSLSNVQRTKVLNLYAIEEGPKLKARVRHTGSIKRGCPFKLIGRYNAAGDCWKLEVVKETHNHGPVVFEEGNPALRKMTDEEVDMVAPLHRQGLRYRNFLVSHGFTFHTLENPSTNRTENIFCCHEKSHTVWCAFPDLFLIDMTYNTNMYKWSFVQFVGVT
ncbi:uncharacterized protein LOC143615922 [Bidens hawaiensis]|uniref:uncharacterized protein LOC143615922 n=1 Tax=Bidens hawaiensis TaxID=980011 RepID=UPI0040495503